MDNVERVYPKEEELSCVTVLSTCPECMSTFKSESNLTLHLAKTHKQAHLLQPSSVPKLYHCPITSCVHHKKSQFKQLKYLKQHYLKVHGKRDFICLRCSKGFPTEAFRNSHAEYCNVLFKCCDCEMYYGCYDTLKTHSRRKQHKILQKIAYKSNNLNLQSRSEWPVQSGSNRLILPKLPPNLELCQSTQTEIWSLQKNSQQTQTTSRRRKPQLTVETQTIGDYYGRKPEKGGANKSANTQTLAVSPKTVSCNTSFNLDDFELMMNEVQRSASSTQTTLDNPEIYSSMTSIHTDTSDLCTTTLDSNFFNMETQTDFMFDDELFKCDYYSNMHTQTCTDLLGEMAFNTIHTQTGLDDVLRSVESQTVVSKKSVLSCKDMSHMETQTDLEFKQMLEEINA